MIECKDYNKKIGLNIVRSALGLREDINHFEMVDVNELQTRKSQRRRAIIEKISTNEQMVEKDQEKMVLNFADYIGSRMAVALTNSG